MEEIFILDHIEDFKLSGDEVKNNYEGRMALARLFYGLSWLNREVDKYERRAREIAQRKDVSYDLVDGDILRAMPCELLSCAFQWYAVSACNYAQLVGWIVTHDTKTAKSYVKRAMPKLHYYRNKVAAHFAIADPYPQDNVADQQASIMTQIIFAHGHLCTAALTPVVSSNEEERTEVSKKLPWSLTQVHKHLSKRYWPTGNPKSFQALRVPAKESINLNLSWENIIEDSA